MASVPIHCEPVKVCAVQALEPCSTPCCLHPEGTRPLNAELRNLTLHSQLGDEFQDFYKIAFGHEATAEVLRHCRRDLMQLILCLLLDDEFMHAYVYGLVLDFIDKICRRFFPRVL